MKLNKKIKGFTLGEMLVVLILTSIVVGLAFSVLSLVQKHMYGIQSNFNKNTELSKLETTLWLDFNRFSKVSYNALESELKFSTEIDSMVYLFEANQIIKGLDTFPIQLKSKTFFFEGNTIESGVIDAIKLETDKTLQNQNLFIYKSNDGATYMN